MVEDILGDGEREPRPDASFPTVADLLDLEIAGSADPEVLAGAAGLRSRVRFVRLSHGTDDLAPALGGVLVVTDVGALRDSPGELVDLVTLVAKRGAAGVLLHQGGSPYPRSVLDVCERAALPLVAVRLDTPLAELAESLQAAQLDHQLLVLHTSDHAQERFVRMCMEGASAQDIVAELSRTCGCPVVFENLVHQVLAYESAGIPAQQLLSQWEDRSRDTPTNGDLSPSGPEGWLAAWVDVRGRTLGRLILLPGGPASPSQRIALRRATTALALNRLLEQNQATLERQAHRSTLADIIEHRYRSPAQMHAHTAAIGVPTKGQALLAVIVDVLAVPSPGATSRESAAETIATVLRGAGVPALVAELRRGRVGALLALGPHEDHRRTLTKFVRELRARVQHGAESELVVAVGSTVLELDQVAHSFTEAHQVADAARGANTGKLYYEPPDIQLRGLLHVLGDDPRLQSFVERTLGDLLDFDRRNDSNLVDSLRTFLLHGGNKSAAAEAAHVARQTFYRRLATVQRILSMDLESAEVRTSLHAAIMALESQRSVRRQGQPSGTGTAMDARSGAMRTERANAESAW